MKKYVIGIDQSTQGTKALLLDRNGSLLCRTDKPHRQIIDENGWVEHDPNEILANVSETVKMLLTKAGITSEEIAGIGLSNQRETGVVWNRETGKPLCNAIVWQCARAKDICDRIAATGAAPMIKERTGINLSPYFTAGKIAWVIENIPGAEELNDSGMLCCGTVDAWLVYKLTGGTSCKTDYSNASRTQLFNIRTLQWDEDICAIFGINPACLPEVCFSDDCFGMTDMLGALDREVPIHAVMGDSHAALYGQGCHSAGMVKCTHGTGSSVMMNVGFEPMFSDAIVSSLAWGINGNINYSAAVITWLKDDLQMISDPGETEALAKSAAPADTTYLVPAFSGLGAPYWASGAKASIVGMSRSTGKAEIVRAAVESIAYQICDVLHSMTESSGIPVKQLRVDGGPTKNEYLMQFESDICDCRVVIPEAEELSGIGAGCLAGISMGLMDKGVVFAGRATKSYSPRMTETEKNRRLKGWHEALDSVIQ